MKSFRKNSGSGIPVRNNHTDLYPEELLELIPEELQEETMELLLEVLGRTLELFKGLVRELLG